MTDKNDIVVDAARTAVGHVSMVVGSKARAQMWEPVANWLEGKF